jgi:quercetin dioxygenase-like cupin family protein
MSGYRLVTEPATIPVPGNKVIEELFGRVNTDTTEFSLAHMIAPAGWEEGWQAPVFGELTIMVRGNLQVEIGEDVLVLDAGHVLWVEPGTRVRYSNPCAAAADYFALCLPAFSPELARREA